jgi:hypothetical protein
MSASNTIVLISAAAVADTLRLSDERDQWLRRLLDAERIAYLLGHADGYRDGYERGARLIEASWPSVVSRLSGSTLAELEVRRWGPGGRAHFGDPRPGDYRGAA